MTSDHLRWAGKTARFSIAHAANKFAARGMTKFAAREIFGRGHPSQLDSPGTIHTPMPALAGEQAYAMLAAEVPLGRYGLPEEIAAIAVSPPPTKARIARGS